MLYTPFGAELFSRAELKALAETLLDQDNIEDTVRYPLKNPDRLFIFYRSRFELSGYWRAAHPDVPQGILISPHELKLWRDGQTYQ